MKLYKSLYRLSSMFYVVKCTINQLFVFKVQMDALDCSGDGSLLATESPVLSLLFVSCPLRVFHNAAGSAEISMTGISELRHYLPVAHNSKPNHTHSKTLVSQLNHFWMGSFPTAPRNYSSTLCRVCAVVCVYGCTEMCVCNPSPMSFPILTLGQPPATFFFFFVKSPLFPPPFCTETPDTDRSLAALYGRAVEGGENHFLVPLLSAHHL